MWQLVRDIDIHTVLRGPGKTKLTLGGSSAILGNVTIVEYWLSLVKIGSHCSINNILPNGKIWWLTPFDS